jgi:prepilin-type N-terminal cleavage/methylation domain-containing protein
MSAQSVTGRSAAGVVRRRRRAARSRRGLTIIELMAAVVILSIGVLGLAGTSTVVTRMIGQADQHTDGASAAQTRFERLRSTRCPITGGSATSPMVERWAVVGMVGPATLRLYEVVDTVTIKTRTRARTQKQSYRSIVRCLP